jgi:GT2 family glycosyltransferase
MHPEGASRLVSVVIPNFNGAEWLETCLRSLLRQTWSDFETVVVDNGSGDSSREVVRRCAPAAVLLCLETNRGFAGAVNEGIRAARGNWIAVLNNDTEVSPTWLAECIGALSRHPDASFLACRILDYRRRGVLYSAGDCFLRAGIGYRRGQELADRPAYRVEEEIFGASGCAALYRKDALETLRGFDDRFFAYLEDVDLALRLRSSGHRGYYVPAAEVYHYGAATSGGEFSSLAVRLRTRNSVLLLLKDLPAAILCRSALMILSAQVFWLARVLRHGKLLSYIRGAAEVLSLAPEMLDQRRKLRAAWKKSEKHLWQEILRSEDMASSDFAPPGGTGASVFLRLYFRLFGRKRPQLETA